MAKCEQEESPAAGILRKQSLNRPKVGVVILNWNTPELTRKCLDSVALLTYTPTKIIVVDNGSEEQNYKFLESYSSSGLHILRSTWNRGFAGGMNLGLEFAIKNGMDLIWLLNSDAFPEPQALGALVEMMGANGRLAAVSPLIRFVDGSPHGIGATLNWGTGEQIGLVADDVNCDMPFGFSLTGAALMVRSTVIKEVGGFDERFFAYREEDDLCLRIVGRGVGELGICRDAKIAHVAQGSTGGRVSPFVTYMLTRNGWLLLRKHVPIFRQPPVLLRYFGRKLLDAGLMLRDGKQDVAHAVLRALADSVACRYGKRALKPPPTWLLKAAYRAPWRLHKIAWKAAALYPLKTPETWRNQARRSSARADVL